MLEIRYRDFYNRANAVVVAVVVQVADAVQVAVRVHTPHDAVAAVPGPKPI